MDHITLYFIIHRLLWHAGLGCPLVWLVGCKADGYPINVISCGKNFMQLFVPYTPGAASGHARKSFSTVTTLQ